jgi:hypothetical protein
MRQRINGREVDTHGVISSFRFFFVEISLPLFLVLHWRISRGQHVDGLLKSREGAAHTYMLLGWHRWRVYTLLYDITWEGILSSIA